MDAISATAESLGWILQNIGTGVHVFLEANYYTVAYLIHVIRSVADTCAEAAVCVYALLKCYYCDFVTFSNELATGLRFIFTVVLNFLSESFDQLHFFYVCATTFINELYIRISNLSNNTVYFCSEVIQNIIYFVRLIFDAVLLILQLGPNLLIFVYESCVYCCVQIWDTVLLVFHFVWENLYNLPTECQKALFCIPLKAYFGIFLFSILFYSRKRVIKHLKLSFKYLLNFLAKFTVFLSYHFHKWLLVIIKIFIYVISCLKSCTRYVLTLRGTGTTSVSNRNSSLRNRDSNHTVNDTCFIYRCIRTILHHLCTPFHQIKEELNEEKVELLQKELSAEKMRRVCIVCHDRERNVLLYPCRHMIMCEQCTEALQESYQSCPLCRKQILNTLLVYT